MKLRILCEKLLIISQRFFGIPPFRFYALADGIKKILSQTSPGPPENRPPVYSWNCCWVGKGRNSEETPALMISFSQVHCRLHVFCTSLFGKPGTQRRV